MRYIDGAVIPEWARDWSHLPYRGRQLLRLYLPDGRLVELGDTRDSTSRFFQFKIGVQMAGGGSTAGVRSKPSGSTVLAHVAGIIVGTDGTCQLAAWEWGPDGKGALKTLTDNAHHLRYHNIGPLCADHLGMAVA